ncbi:MAG TPA: ribulose-phosphate 3-epimerase [candidate division Zixibacteria bacterium]|nr:ribulose-phosphate 3-epimerase [candidate division Zixibacteria bacterium]
MIKLAPSILGADFGHLEEEIIKTNESGCDWIHLDIMDGHLVPNISFGPAIVKYVKSRSDLFLDSHLMISNPEKYLEVYAEAGSDLIVIHYEIEHDKIPLLEKIRKLGKKAGISINPHTPLEAVTEILEHCDLILIMTVHPGFSGQKFMNQVLPKIRQAREYIDSNNLNIEIEVDGGVGLETAKKVIDAGADILVAGSAFYKSGDYREFNRKIKDLAEKS